MEVRPVLLDGSERAKKEEEEEEDEEINEELIFNFNWVRCKYPSSYSFPPNYYWAIEERDHSSEDLSLYDF